MYLKPLPERWKPVVRRDHPLHIAMESLIRQENLTQPILTLGSQSGVKGYVGRRVRGA